MRRHIGLVVVLMVLLGVSAVVQLRPPVALILIPGNFVVAAALLGGAVALLLRHRLGTTLALCSAGVTVLGGVLSLRDWGTRLPHHPMLWIVMGLYLGLRVALVNHAEEAQQRRGQLQKALRLAQQDPPGEETPSAGPPHA